MASATTPLLKPLSMADTSLPTLFTPKTPHPFPSLSLKPIKHIHLTINSTSSLVSLRNNKLPSNSLLTLVASSTSDWAQEEEEEEEQQQVGPPVDVENDYIDPPEDAKLFVGNLPYDVDSEHLAQLFEEAGVVQVSEVIYNRETAQSRGFGFVWMQTIEEAEKAINMFNRYDLNGRYLTVNKAAPKGSRPERSPRTFEPSFRIYVGNLPWQVDDARLEQMFSEHGKVVQARVVLDRDTARSRGFGFVTMSTQSEMDDAIEAMDGQSLDGRAIRVNVAQERPRRSF